jgi:xylitol oxidase
VAPADVWEVKKIFDMPDVRHIKIVGTKHSFNDIADTDGVLISLKRFKSIEFKANNQVTFGAGWTYSELIEELKKKKLALH